jgi:hypothetical protein
MQRVTLKAESRGEKKGTVFHDVSETKWISNEERKPLKNLSS